jgi:hypothetical protein
VASHEAKAPDDSAARRQEAADQQRAATLRAELDRLRRAADELTARHAAALEEVAKAHGLPSAAALVEAGRLLDDSGCSRVFAALGAVSTELSAFAASSTADSKRSEAAHRVTVAAERVRAAESERKILTDLLDKEHTALKALHDKRSDIVKTETALRDEERYGWTLRRSAVCGDAVR